MNICLIAGSRKGLRSAVFASIVAFAASVAAQPDKDVELNPSHPDSYVVERGDTLWDISALFLKEPWFWPEIWYVNPQIENPHLIYPGDLLTLVYVDGRPQLRLERGAPATARLSPHMRSEARETAITTIPFNSIEAFLRGGLIMDKNEADSLPYIVAFRDHLIGGAGNEVFVRNLADDEAIGDEFSVLRLNEELRDPNSGKVLGYEVMFIANAELRAHGDPDTLFLTESNREARHGDRIRKSTLTLPMNFYPSAPEQEVNSTIISVVDGVSRIGQYQMVILNKGLKDGLDSGNVLAVWQKGDRVSDRIGYGSSFKKVALPDAYAGNVMVVKAYEDVSYALVMEAELDMRVGDSALNP